MKTITNRPVQLYEMPASTICIENENRYQLPSAAVSDELSQGGDQGEVCEALRCACGSLLARLVDDRVELKCRRCKRTVLVSLAERNALQLEPR